MKRAFLVLFFLVPILSSCAPKKTHLHAVTTATPKLEAADARGSSYQPPVEDASAWPDMAPPADSATSGTVKLMGGSNLYIEGYTDKKSYLPGETINFHVSTTTETYIIEIIKEQWSRPKMAKVTGIEGQYYPIPPFEQKPWANGANWPVSYQWVIPEQWESGSYLARFICLSDGQYDVAYNPFIVRTRVPGSRSKIALVMNYNTRHAYNYWGGKSLYASVVPGDPHYGIEVSFLRPFKDSSGRGKNYWGSWELASQLVEDGFDPEFLTEYDICSNPAILMAYDVLVLAGHHEYISRNTYDALDAFHARGGHIAFFSGNDIYWQVRFEDDGDTMVSYKSYALREDPMRDVEDSLVTLLWSDPPVNRPAEALQGVSYEPYSYCFEAEPYVVRDADHFIFEGTGVQNGDKIGHKVAASETDYIGPASPPLMDVLMTARRENLTPTYKYSGYVKVDHVNAASVYYKDSPEYGYPNGKGGQIFSAGSEVGWGDSIGNWSPGYETMRKITRNILRHMLDAPRPKPDYQDLATATSHWLGQCESPDWCRYADINMDGVVNIADFAYLAEDWSRE